MSNTRIITALIAFVATFIFSAGLVRIIFPAPATNYVYTERSVLPATGNEIENFLLRDISNGTARIDNAYDSSYADRVTEYWKASSSMDASRFPQDFQRAWNLHMQAWGNYAEYLQAKKVSNRKSCGMDNYYNAEIGRTWDDVTRIGGTYGSNVR
ncbi:MAG TPA: hypothetical protein VIL74_16725 [Pyrinomonadaceae bacterium]|jgi:hypothetical protein